MDSIVSISDVIKLQNACVLVIGDILLDIYIDGKVSRISPEAPVPVVLESKRKYVAGGAANVAANVASFGGKAWICGRTGQDYHGEILKKICTDLGIRTEYLMASANASTITKTRVLAGYQQIVRIDKEKVETLPDSEMHLILKHVDHFLKQPGEKTIVISDYAKGLLSKDLISWIIEAATKNNVLVVTDPKSIDVSRYRGSYVIKPNLKDGFELLHSCYPHYGKNDFDTDMAKICDCFLEQGAAANVVLSLSEKGILIKGNDQKIPLHLQSHALDVADVSGAGDTMVAFLAMGLSVKMPLALAAKISNVAAGIVCGKPGTATVSIAEVMESLRSFDAFKLQDPLLSLRDAKAIINIEKAKGKKIVFTNGCFDILHAGHVQLLQKAKSYGDFLVVGLNSDNSIKRLKGPSRPVQTCMDRATLLAALSCVDLVVEFEEDTPLDLITELEPDILVKGGDYSLEQIVGAKEVLSWGGKVEIFPLLEGRSTTNILKKAPQELKG